MKFAYVLSVIASAVYSTAADLPANATQPVSNNTTATPTLIKELIGLQSNDEAVDLFNACAEKGRVDKEFMTAIYSMVQVGGSDEIFEPYQNAASGKKFSVKGSWTGYTNSYDYDGNGVVQKVTTVYNSYEPNSWNRIPEYQTAFNDAFTKGAGLRPGPDAIDAGHIIGAENGGFASALNYFPQGAASNRGGCWRAVETFVTDLLRNGCFPTSVATFDYSKVASGVLSSDDNVCFQQIVPYAHNLLVTSIAGGDAYCTEATASLKVAIQTGEKVGTISAGQASGLKAAAKGQCINRSRKA